MALSTCPTVGHNANNAPPPNYHEDWPGLRIPKEEMMYFNLEAPPRLLSDHQLQVKETRIKDSKLYLDVPPEKEPIVYHPGYNVSFGVLDPLIALLHPFDSVKYGRIHDFLLAWGVVREDQFVQPKEATQSDLLVVHTPEYLASLQRSYRVSQILEVLPAALLPNFIIQARILRPFRTQAGGSVLAGKLAIERGWAINLGGGFHHACAYMGTKGGYCIYADITMLVDFARARLGIRKVLIVDLDAHQGNGHERDFIGDDDAYIIDAHNEEVDPWDHPAKPAIRGPIRLTCGIRDADYLRRVEEALMAADAAFSPDLVVYAAGTDVLEGDPLGLLRVTAEGIVMRDEMVFEYARIKRKVPIVMLTSGGYQNNNAEIIATSIANLASKSLISLKPRNMS